MADFVQTMKNWRRMCKFCSDEGMADGRHGCVDECPIGHNNACGNIEAATDRDIEVMAKEIAKWAAEHPEPVYPTWGEWLMSIGVINGVHPHGAIDALGNLKQPIPAEYAEKLEIEPKA